MKINITSTEDIGTAIRAVRKSIHVRQDDLAGGAKVSKQFAIDVERGKTTMQLGKVLLLLQELGIPLTLDIPDEAFRLLPGIKARKQVKPKKAITAKTGSTVIPPQSTDLQSQDFLEMK
jgi:transcriptional regulator with XRE-family HTH domain